MNKTKVHKHRWCVQGGNVVTTMLHCSCGEHKERPANKQEAVNHKQWIKDISKRHDTIHRVSHIFQRKFFEKGTGAWKWTGYSLMCKMEKWAQKYPEDVFSAGIDDSHFCGSDIYFILHRDGKVNWGTSVVVITQCDGQLPCQYFMYPGHLSDIMDVLKKIDKMPRDNRDR